jgi:hypothetical protein
LQCLAIAEAGLNHLHNTFEFVRGDTTTSLADAMKRYKGSFITREIQGTGRVPTSFQMDVPYKGNRMSGMKLKEQLDRW